MLTNNFCHAQQILSVKQKTPPQWIKHHINQNEMKNKCPFYIVFQVLKVCLLKTCKIEPPNVLFVVVFISFYISRYNYWQLFRTSFNIICKKDFCHEFIFKQIHSTPRPLNGQNPLSVTKAFRWCALTSSNFAFSSFWVYHEDLFFVLFSSA